MPVFHRLVSLLLLLVSVQWNRYYRGYFVSALAAPRSRLPKRQPQKSNAPKDSISISYIRPSVSLSPMDVKNVEALADLRYQEWMMDEPVETRPSLLAFRSATAEIQQERIVTSDSGDSHYGAIPFVARCQMFPPKATTKAAGTGFGGGGKIKDRVKTTKTSSSPTTTTTTTTTEEIAGAAELSPLEFQGCFDRSTSSTNNEQDTNSIHSMNAYRNNHYWYVTDVVTAQKYRRKGVAAALMKAVEDYALEHSLETTTTTHENKTVLLMHVEPENEGALKFYQRLGYEKVFSSATSAKQGGDSTIVFVDYLMGVDVDKLAENAGVSGQWLLGKQL